MNTHAGRSGALTHEGHVVRVAVEAGNVSLDPLHYPHLIQQSRIARQVARV